MKLYKLWLEVEEFDTFTGEYRNLAEEGRAEPVPVAIFSDLETARLHAESFAMDGIRFDLPWLKIFDSIN